jgi:hypothetical protein
MADDSGTKAVALLLCERAIHEGMTRQFHLIGMMERLSVPTLPIVLPNLTVYIVLERDPLVEPEKQFYVGLLGPSGGLLAQGVLVPGDWGPLGTSEAAGDLSGVTLREAGVHTVRLFVEGRILAERRLLVERR